MRSSILSLPREQLESFKESEMEVHAIQRQRRVLRLRNQACRLSWLPRPIICIHDSVRRLLHRLFANRRRTIQPTANLRSVVEYD